MDRAHTLKALLDNVVAILVHHTVNDMSFQFNNHINLKCNETLIRLKCKLFISLWAQIYNGQSSLNPDCYTTKNGLVPTAHVLMHTRTIPQNLGNPVTSVNYQ